MKTTGTYTALIEQALRDYLTPREPRGLYDPIIYAMTGGGKRLRPVLCLAAAEAVGGPEADAVDQAIAIEMFHNFTLLHDDVMDRSDTRRGRPAVHVRYNESTAILSGDAMLTLASISAPRGCSDALGARILHRFNKMAMEVYEGQQLDMDFESRTDVTIGEYLEMIRLKTSVLLGASAAIGAMKAGADDETVEAFNEYGEKLGLSFQLKDDWLDTFGDSATFGKPIGGDIVNNKKTWLLISALELDSTGQLRGLLEETIAPAEKVEKVRQIYMNEGLSEKCQALERIYAEEAVKALSRAEIPLSAREFFKDIAVKSLSRDR